MGTQYLGVICNYFIAPILISTVQHTLLTQLRTGVTSFTHVARKTGQHWRKQLFKDRWKEKGDDETEKSTDKGQTVDKTETEQEEQ